MKYIIIIMFLLVGAGCTAAPSSAPISKDQSLMDTTTQNSTSYFPEQNQLNYYTIPLGKELIINPSLRVKFVDVIEDGRCPKELDCYWAGRATIDTVINNRDQPTSQRFKIDGMNRNPKDGTLKPGVRVETFSIGGWEISFIDLAPYPEAKKQIDKKLYIGLFRIEPAK